jgi:hypothetical protein
VGTVGVRIVGFIVQAPFLGAPRPRLGSAEGKGRGSDGKDAIAKEVS